MRRLFLLLAMLAAMVSGWTPALAATQQAGMAGMHAAHGPAPRAAGHHGDGRYRGHGDDRHADAEQATQSPGGEHPDGQRHAAQHPLLCSACFAVVAESEALPSTFAKAGATALPVSIFCGGEVLPPVPPPRPVRS